MVTKSGAIQMELRFPGTRLPGAFEGMQRDQSDQGFIVPGDDDLLTGQGGAGEYGKLALSLGDVVLVSGGEEARKDGEERPDEKGGNGPGAVRPLGREGRK